jgi:hypothetical protein
VEAGGDVAVQNETRVVGPKFPIRVYIRRGGPIPDLDIERRETIYLIIFAKKSHLEIGDATGIGHLVPRLVTGSHGRGNRSSRSPIDLLTSTLAGPFAAHH